MRQAVGTGGQGVRIAGQAGSSEAMGQTDRGPGLSSDILPTRRGAGHNMSLPAPRHRVGHCTDRSPVRGNAAP
jgi:hypothetical protein